MTLLDITALIGTIAAVVLIGILLILVIKALKGIGRLSRSIHFLAKQKYVNICLECEKRGLMDSDEIGSVLKSAKDDFHTRY